MGMLSSFHSPSPSRSFPQLSLVDSFLFFSCLMLLYPIPSDFFHSFSRHLAFLVLSFPFDLFVPCPSFSGEALRPSLLTKPSTPHPESFSSKVFPFGPPSLPGRTRSICFLIPPPIPSSDSLRPIKLAMLVLSLDPFFSLIFSLLLEHDQLEEIIRGAAGLLASGALGRRFIFFPCPPLDLVCGV